MKIYLNILLFIVPIMTAHAQEKKDKLCVVVSGVDRDHNGFLDNEFFTKGKEIAGEKCHVFGSWTDAVNFTKSNLKPEGKLLIVQGAHGDDGESDTVYHLNNGDVFAKNIYSYIKDLSENFHVGSIIHSCKSAAIMSEKLIDDQKSNNRLDKLCLISSSSFGRITYSDEDDIVQRILQIKKDDNLEKPFLEAPGGLISSASWTDVGLPEYLLAVKTGHKLAESLDKGFKVLEEMGNVMPKGPQCKTSVDANLVLCTSPMISDEIYSDLMRIADPRIIFNAKENFLKKYSKNLSRFQENLQKKPKDEKTILGLNCTQMILQAYKKKYGEDLKDLKTFQEIKKAKDDIEQSAFYKSQCIQYISKIEPKEDQEWYAETLSTGPMFDNMQAYFSSVNRLSKKYTKRKFDENFDVFSFANDTLAEKSTCKVSDRPKLISQKKTTIQSVFGNDFFDSEYTDGTPDEMLQTKVSTQRILQDFQSKSLKDNSIKSSKDLSRRKACRDFVF